MKCRFPDADFQWPLRSDGTSDPETISPMTLKPDNNNKLNETSVPNDREQKQNYDERE
jgi:hypothetical protein